MSLSAHVSIAPGDAITNDHLDITTGLVAQRRSQCFLLLIINVVERISHTGTPCGVDEVDAGVTIVANKIK